MRFLLFFVCIGVLLTVTPVSAQPSVYEVDMEASLFEFEVEHFGIATVVGTISEGSGTIVFSAEEPDSLRASIQLEVSSIDTDNRLRDRELKSEDFLDVRRHPTVTFFSTGVGSEGVTGETTVSIGNLSIFGFTRSVSIPIRVDLSGEDLVVESSFEVLRTDYDLDFGILMNSLVSDEVIIRVRMVARMVQ